MIARRCYKGICLCLSEKEIVIPNLLVYLGYISSWSSVNWCEIFFDLISELGARIWGVSSQDFDVIIEDSLEKRVGCKKICSWFILFWMKSKKRNCPIPWFTDFEDISGPAHLSCDIDILKFFYFSTDKVIDLFVIGKNQCIQKLEFVQVHSM